MLTSKTVTAEDAARYREGDDSAARAVIGDGFASPAGEPLHVLGADGLWRPVGDGEWVVRFAAGDHTIMTPKEHDRLFGQA